MNQPQSPSEPRVYRASNGTEIESDLALHEAIDLCSQRSDQFSIDLARKARTYAPSDQQIAWLHIKAVQFRNWKRRQQQTPTSINAVGIVQLFKKATASGLTHPAIRIAAGSDNTTIKLTVAGERAQFPGAINVKAVVGGAWYGRIMTNGDLHLKGDTPQWVTDLLVELAKDPVAVAKQYAQITESCSFCGQPLTDGRSTTVGYGPICANRYSLPWGKDKGATTDD